MLDLTTLTGHKGTYPHVALLTDDILPDNLWKSYSSFANTTGGTILLDVKEESDSSLQIEGVSNPENLLKEFWSTINNSDKVSVNLLSEDKVRIEKVGDRQIVVIEVPPASRLDKPVYINGNPLTGTYRRNGEGDFLCKMEVVRSMIRDASNKIEDANALEYLDKDVLDKDSVRSYRNRMRLARLDHIWNTIPDEDFLYRIGALSRREDGKYCPTVAGLLMFGKDYEITKVFPNYFLDYQERLDSRTDWIDRFVSSSGDWSGNVYDFYFRVFPKVTQSLKVPFVLEGPVRVEDTPGHKAIREALANCLVNADYYASGNLTVIRYKDKITLTNPGCFRIDLEAALIGGISDPRNGTLLKFFNLLDIGERAGSGIPRIYDFWNKQGLQAPFIQEFQNPDRVTLTLPLTPLSVAINSGDKRMEVAINAEISGDKHEKPVIRPEISGDKHEKPVISPEFSGDKHEKPVISSEKKRISGKHYEQILQYLKDNERATIHDFSNLLGLKDSWTRDLLAKLTEKGIVKTGGSRKYRYYYLNRNDKDE